FVTAAINIFKVIATLRTKLAFNIYSVVSFDLGAELGGYQMERLFVHRTVLDRVHGSVLGSAPPLEAPLEHRHDGRFAAANRAHEEEYSLANFQTLARGFEVFDDPRDGSFNTKQLVGKKIVSNDFVARVFVYFLDARRKNHVADSSVREL